eukprot:TRINITY_DN15893_c0_g1_i1.p1 TRINITY_DN15893_c0_g1~~TRINITY_DN15893_c0_g1_i1.p1  ORF type:complete len:941 (+),score=160.47 TRINITY_DN15893_c0_g1_i1:96-2918(+)
MGAPPDGPPATQGAAAGQWGVMLGFADGCPESRRTPNFGMQLKTPTVVQDAPRQDLEESPLPLLECDPDPPEVGHPALDPVTAEVASCLEVISNLSEVLSECATPITGTEGGLLNGDEIIRRWALHVPSKRAAAGVRRIGELLAQQLIDLRRTIAEQVVAMYNTLKNAAPKTRTFDDFGDLVVSPKASPHAPISHGGYGSMRTMLEARVAPFEQAERDARALMQSRAGQAHLGAQFKRRARRASSIGGSPPPAVTFDREKSSPSFPGHAAPDGAKVKPLHPASLNKVRNVGSCVSPRKVDDSVLVEGQLGATLHLTLTALAAGVECEKATVWVAVDRHDRSDGELRTTLRCIAVYPTPPPLQPDPRDIETNSGQGLAGAVFQTGVALNVSNTRQTSLWDADEARKAGYDVKAVLCLPLWSVGNSRHPIGVLQLYNKRPPATRFTAEDERAALHRTDIVSQVVGRFHPRHFMRKFNPAMLDNVTTVPPGLADGHGGEALEMQGGGGGGELMQNVANTRAPQRIYRTGVRPVHITAKETLTAEAVITDGSNLRDLSQQIAWMENMWRTSLDENAAMTSERNWWQLKCAEAQARMRWLERLHERAARAPDLERVRAALTSLPPEPSERRGGTAGVKPTVGRVRAFSAEDPPPQHELVTSQERRWAAFLGAPFEDKETQTERSGARRGSTARRGSYMVGGGDRRGSFFGGERQTSHRPSSTFFGTGERRISSFGGPTIFTSSDEMASLRHSLGTRGGASPPISATYLTVAGSPAIGAREGGRQTSSCTLSVPSPSIPPVLGVPQIVPASATRLKDFNAQKGIPQLDMRVPPPTGLQVQQSPGTPQSARTEPSPRGSPRSTRQLASAAVASAPAAPHPPAPARAPPASARPRSSAPPPPRASLDPKDYRSAAGPSPLVCPPLELPTPPAAVQRPRPPRPVTAERA